MLNEHKAGRFGSPFAMAWRRFRSNRVALAGLILVCGTTLAVTVGPLVWTESTERINFEDAEERSSRAHPLGTDELGRDLLARILDGGRVSLAVAYTATVLSLILGVSTGAIAGYTGSWIDGVLMRITDMFLAIPVLPVLILCTALFAKDGTFRKRFLVITIVIGCMNWMATARLTRSSIMSIKQSEYALAARAIGTSSPSLVIKHLLPNAFGPICIITTLGVGAVVILESSLSFLGLGFQPPQATWGRMLYEAQSTLASNPFEALVAGITITVFVFSINSVGEGLRDALDTTDVQRR